MGIQHVGACDWRVLMIGLRNDVSGAYVWDLREARRAAHIRDVSFHRPSSQNRRRGPGPARTSFVSMMSGTPSQSSTPLMRPGLHPTAPTTKARSRWRPSCSAAPPRRACAPASSPLATSRHPPSGHVGRVDNRVVERARAVAVQLRLVAEHTRSQRELCQSSSANNAP